MNRAVVLFSGGMDSTVALHLAMLGYADVHAVTVYYQQRHTCELTFATATCKWHGLQEHRVRIDESLWRTTNFLSGDLEANRTVGDIRSGGLSGGIAPGRNLIFAGYAIAICAQLGGGDVILGCNADDAAGFPDCRPEAIAAMTAMASACGLDVTVTAPLSGLTKRQIAGLGLRLGIDFDAHTWSCYRPRYDLAGAQACGRCDACVLRADALANAGAA